MTGKPLILIAACGLLGACAASTTGVHQTVTVQTAPARAQCQLERQGEVIARIAQTPATVRVDKSRHGIWVRCRKAGFREAGGPLDPQFQTASVGNAVGVLGAGVDALAGSLYHYPGRIRLGMTAQAADDAAAVAAYYDRRRAAIERAGDEALARLARDCGDEAVSKSCEREADRIRALRDERLARVRAAQGD